jgi:hypothetical protein
MPPSLGTRTKQSTRQEHISTLSETARHQQDLGLAKRVTVSATFAAATGRVTAAGGTFAAFAVGDDVLIEGANLNNGSFHVNATDASTYLALDQGVKNEGPLSVTIRTV